MAGGCAVSKQKDGCVGASTSDDRTREGEGRRAILGSGFGGGQKESFEKYIILKNVYKNLGRWKLAAEAAEYAAAMRPDWLRPLQPPVQGLPTPAVTCGP